MESIKMLIEKFKDGSIKEMWEEIRWMFSYGKNYKKEIVFYTILGVFSTVMSLISSVASKELINIVTGIQTNRALEMAVLMVSMSLFSLLFNQAMSRITLKINIRIQNEIQADIFDKIIEVNWLDLSRYHGGDLPGGSGEKGPSGRTGQPERKEGRPLPGVSVLLWPRRAVCSEGRHGPAAGEGGPGRFAGAGFAYLLV